MNHRRTFARGAAHRAALWCATTIAVVGFVSACSGGDSRMPPPSGMIQGRFLIEGGPAPGTAHAIPGTVMVHGPSDRALTVGADARFQVRVADGVYTLSGRSPNMNSNLGVCQALHPVTVRTDQTVRLDLVCEVP